MVTDVMTVFTTELSKAGKGGKDGDAQITDAEFIKNVFSKLPEGAFSAVCSKTGDPSCGGWLASRADSVIKSISAGIARLLF